MTNDEQRVQLQAPSNTDPEWRKKALAAREAREGAAKMRRGRGLGFRKAVGYTAK